MSKVNYGIIGCGMMGQEHLRNIALLPEARVAAIYEPDAEQRTISAGFAPEARFVDSINSLLAHQDLDCLLIASPNHLHVDQFEQIAKTRPLPLLIEKPLFTAPDQAGRLKQLQSSYPAPVWVAMEYRYMPPIQKLIEEADKTTGGITMLTIREHRFPFLPKIGNWNRFNRNTGGTLVEKCCHFFDLMRLLTKSEPVRIMASAGQDVNHLEEVYDGEVPDIWDAGFVIVDFESGARAMLELCMYAEGSRFQEEITAIGPSGKIEARVPGPGRFWPPHLGPAPIPEIVVSPRNPPGPVITEIPVDPMALAVGDHNGSTLIQHQKFIDMLRGGTAPEVTLSDGYIAVEMGYAAQKSARNGQAVSLNCVVH